MSCEIYLCAYARHFPAQALLRLRPELRARPVAVLDGEAPFQQVCSSNKAARLLGVLNEMSRSEMDSFPSVVLLKRSLHEEQAARKSFFECAGHFSPRVEELATHNTLSCILDIAGTEKLLGSPKLVATRLRQQYAELGIVCSAAVSHNFYTALSVARGTAAFRHPVVVPEGEERQALAPLPLSVLDISPRDTETFSQWGVTTLGSLAMLPETDLISRLGQQGRYLRELARGEAPHLFQPHEPTFSLDERIDLDAPVEALDSLLFGVGLMLEKLIARVTTSVLSLAFVVAELELEGGSVHTRSVRPALPTNDKQLWLKLIHLDWIAHPPTAAVLSLRLHAETGTNNTIQLGLFSPQLPESARLDVTLARIRAIVGEERAGSIELTDSNAPESFQVKSFTITSNNPKPPLAPRLSAAVLRCLRPAEKLIVTLKDECPHFFYFRGNAYDVESSYGPWRAVGGWWAHGHWSVEEWDIVARKRNSLHNRTKGNILCCCISRDVAKNIWQIEALYD